MRNPANQKSPQANEAPNEEAIATIIKGINLLIAESSAANLGMAMRILFSAREELVHWAVNMNFHESSEEHFLNNQLYNSTPFLLGEFIKCIKTVEDVKIRNSLLKQIGIS